MEANWDDALYLDDETAALLFENAHAVVDVPHAESDLIEHGDVHSLFLFYNDKFFGGALNSVEVKWSSRMTLCAGLCCYDKGGYCVIKLSEPILKFRPAVDLVQTLLHEMIHALLFVTKRDRDRDAHGPEFLSHMARINSAGGFNISVFHSFHDEVDFYRQHWWKCQKCAYVVKRAMNRAPGPSDWWWARHKQDCGGNYIKIKEPTPNLKKRKQPTQPASSEQRGAMDKFLVQQDNELAASSDFLPPTKRRKEDSSSSEKQPIVGRVRPSKTDESTANLTAIVIDDEDHDIPTSPTRSSSSLAKSEGNVSMVSCPACSCLVGEIEINIHLNSVHGFN